MAGLCVLLIAGIVVAALMYSKVHAANALDANRRDALSAAEQFALRMDAFDGTNLDSYIKSIEPMLTTKEKAEFTSQFSQFKKVYQQAQAAQTKAGKKTTTGTGSGKIQLAGVADVDSDSATVLVAHDSSIPGTSDAVHSRWTVSMEKVGGHWLVDSFVPVS